MLKEGFLEKGDCYERPVVGMPGRISGRSHPVFVALVPSGIGSSRGSITARSPTRPSGRASSSPSPGSGQPRPNSHESLSGQLWPDRLGRRLDPGSDHFQGRAIGHDGTEAVGNCQPAWSTGFRGGDKNHPSANSTWRSPTTSSSGNGASTATWRDSASPPPDSLI